MPGPDGLLRCPWALSATEYLAYHDNEWGRPVTSVQGLAPLSGVAALLAGWTQLGVAFLLLGIAALLGGVALLYRPELPRRLLAWLINETIRHSQRTVTTGISSRWSPE
jgi:DNA-3-methyladenine glycosylase I